MNREQLQSYKRIQEGYKRYHNVVWKNQREVYCVNNDKTYESISAASRAFGISRACIMDVCTGKQANTQGYVFKYIE